MKGASRGYFRLTYAAWLIGIIAFFMPAATWNPVSRLALTRAIVERGALSIDAYASSTGDRALVHGQWFTDKAPIPSLVAVPFYAAIHAVQRLRGTSPQYQAFSVLDTPAVRLVPNVAFRQALYACSILTSGVAGVAIGLLLFELLRRRTTARLAFIASVAAVLGSPILPYATSFYGHVPAGAALLGALVALDLRGQRAAGNVPSRVRVRCAGACLALAPGCEYITAGPAAIIALVYLLRVPRAALPRVLVDLALGAIGPVVAVSTYHTAVFGAPWRTGYSFIARPEFAAGHARGLLGIALPTWDGLTGLTVGTRRGLFYLSPVLAAGLVVGLRRAIRTRDRAVLVGIGAFILLLCMNAGYYMWWGGAAAGPRHLVPVMAFLAPGVAFALRRRRSWIAPLTTVLIVISIANGLALTLAGVEAPEFGNILSGFAWRELAAGRVASANGATNIGIKLGLSPALSPVPLLLWLIGGYTYLASQLRAPSRNAEEIA